MSSRSYASLIIIAVLLPVILYGVCSIGPTFDDYTSLQSTWFIQISDPGYMFPDAWRRPFDFLLGCLLGWFPSLFPVLNHVLMILGHTLSALLVFSICKRLSFSSLATNIATLFFFFSPATLGATLACDGFNQTYAQLWGLLALWFYLVRVSTCQSATKNKTWLWLLFVVLAVLSKENGLAWAVVPPIIAYAFQLINRRLLFRHIGYGLLVAITYFLIYGIIYVTGITGIEYDEQYTDATLMSHVKDFLQLMAYTWVPADYMSIVYPPTRHLLIAIITLLLALPFLLLLVSRWKLLKTRQLLLLLLCFLILVSPHLLTVVSIMHNYAALSMAALIVAFILTSISTVNRIFTSDLISDLSHRSHSISYGLPIVTFILFLSAAIFTDIHHYQAAHQSGQLSKQLAMQAISQAERPLERALCINIDDPQEPRYSNFRVRPVDAFAWGLSVRHYSHYTWKTAISEITLPQYNEQQVKALADSALQAGNEAVWVVGHDKKKVTVITDGQS